MDLVNGMWGVALLRVQANLPDTLPGQNVTMLLFGDVAIENAGGTRASITQRIIANTNLNVRGGPGTTYAILGVLGSGQRAVADGRTSDSRWLHIQRDEGSAGWVIANAITATGDINQLPVIGANENPERRYGPMQAFYFRSGIGDAGCDNVPASGMLIQTPQGVGEIELLVNEVRVSLGSTVYLSAKPNQALTVGTLEGHATVEVNGITQTAIAGTQVQVPVGEDLRPIAPPLPPEPLDTSIIGLAPVEALPVPVTIPPPIQPPQPTATPESIILPELPTSGACVIATANPIFVNVRSGPSTSFSTVGTGLNPERIYNVIGRTADYSWYQIENGWVSGSVTRLGGNCANVPITYTPPTATPTPTATPDVDRMPVYHDIYTVTVRAETGAPYVLYADITGAQTDGCDYPVETDIFREGTFVYVDVYRMMPVDAICPSSIIPYNASIYLGDGFGYDIYTVIVNDVEGMIDLRVK